MPLRDFVSTLPPVQDASSGGQKTDSQASRRTDPVVVEVPVVVLASCYSGTAQGVSKALPPAVHEETRTAIVFLEGAVVLLSATLMAGELVMLTNQQNGADALCRVVNVKAQPGIQNYVDLEFTQRVPGFWGDCFLSERPARPERPLPTLARPTVATGAAVPKRVLLQQAVSLSVPAAEPSSVAEMQAPAPAPASASSPIPLAAPKPPASFPARAAGISPSNRIMGISSGSRPVASEQISLLRPTPTGGQQVRNEQHSSSSKKTLLAAAAVVIMVGLTAAGGFMLGRRSQSGSVANPIVSDAQSFSELAHDALIYSKTHMRTYEDDVLSAAEATPAISTTAIQPEISTPQPTLARSGSTVQPTPRRSEVTVERLEAPVRKNAGTVAPSEPPFVLTPQGHGSAENVLAGLLDSAGRPNAPAPPAAFPGANSPARPGGQLQEPRLIYSPAPMYPIMARVQNLQGIVVVDALIDATGKVTETSVLSGPMVFRQTAMDALRNWKYQPARLNGRPIAVHTNLNISFTLG